MISLVGKKIGMTRLFDNAGLSVPVTVIKIEPNRVVQVKSVVKDGYSALKITTGTVKSSRLNLPEKGIFSKAGVVAGRGLWELRDYSDIAEGYKLGGELNVDLLSGISKVDVCSVSKGKGFAGAVKRWNFRTQDFSHGNSVSHRAIGSVGQCQTPGRVFKGKKMPGQMGNKQVSVQSLCVVKVDLEGGLLFVKGGVPGSSGSDVVVSQAIKI